MYDTIFNIEPISKLEMFRMLEGKTCKIHTSYVEGVTLIFVQDLENGAIYVVDEIKATE